MDAPQNIPTHPSIANTTPARAQPADPRPVTIAILLGLAATFATSGSATYADSSLARLAWGASFAVLLIDLVILALAAPAQPGPASTGLLPNLGGYAILALGSVIFLSVIASITVVRLGGIVGGWLRRGYR